jgi:hypothetical protein
MSTYWSNIMQPYCGYDFENIDDKDSICGSTKSIRGSQGSIPTLSTASSCCSHSIIDNGNKSGKWSFKFKEPKDTETREHEEQQH